MCAWAKSPQSCLTLCDPLDCSPPRSSVHGILQARILEWVATPFSRGSSQPRDQTTSFMSPVLAGGFFTTSVTLETSFHEIYCIKKKKVTAYLCKTQSGHSAFFFTESGNTPTNPPRYIFGMNYFLRNHKSSRCLAF